MSGGAFCGSLQQPPSHKSTVAEMKGGEDPVEARGDRGRNENEHTGLITAAQMKDEQAVKDSEILSVSNACRHEWWAMYLY